MNENTNKILILSLLAYTIGGFLFAAGVNTASIVSILVFYMISVALYVSGILCLYKNYKKYHGPALYLFLTLVGIIFLIMITLAFIAII